MSVALVVGNGESRANIDISKFSLDYTIIGCNALHRDLRLDDLVCCDRRMAEEAVMSENTKGTKIYVRSNWYNYFRKIRKDKRINEVPELPYQGELKADQPIHWGSGPYAVLLAAQNYDSILLLGFDLYPSNDKVNNMYKGTKNYSSPDSKPVDPNFWIYQIAKVFENYPEKDFIIWNKKDWKFPREWEFDNVRFEEIE